MTIEDKYLDTAASGLIFLFIIPVLVIAFPFWLVGKILEKAGVIKWIEQ